MAAESVLSPESAGVAAWFDPLTPAELVSEALVSEVSVVAAAAVAPRLEVAAEPEPLL
ncbi:hypothetical protein AB0383_31730 [Amycolatopsis sp. NPDC051373]|uniref:hypothetical protein n=1 Tax=Amycolatopsis sp. NPDC051373 TaxID=3155801 RepID=UPI00344D26D4